MEKISKYDDDEVTERWATEKFAEVASMPLADFRAALDRMTDDERWVLLYHIREGYCRDCGRAEPIVNGWRNHCQCSNDE